MAKLDGKVALVTGGASGIGAAIVELFAGEGAIVACADVQRELGEAVVDAVLRKVHGECIFAMLDVTQESQWREAVAFVEERYGSVDVLVNNAGVGVPRRSDGRRMRIDELPVTEWDRVMAVNATGAFLGIKHVVGPMRRAGGGSIVNMSSAAGIVGTHAAAYSASKGAVRLLTKAAALELAADNIRCNSVHPGVIETPITAELRGDPDARARAIEAHPLGRFGQPAEVARGCLYLACEDSSFVTGSELVIDGGRTAQ